MQHILLIISISWIYLLLKLHSQKRASWNKSIDILQQLIRYQDASAWPATACYKKYIASCQKAWCKLSTDLLQVVSTSYNKSANDNWQVVTSPIVTACYNWMKMTSFLQLVDKLQQAGKVTTCSVFIGVPQRQMQNLVTMVINSHFEVKSSQLKQSKEWTGKTG